MSTQSSAEQTWQLLAQSVARLLYETPPLVVQPYMKGVKVSPTVTPPAQPVACGQQAAPPLPAGHSASLAEAVFGVVVLLQAVIPPGNTWSALPAAQPCWQAMSGAP